MQTDPTSRYRKYERLECFVNGGRYLLDSLPERRVSLDGGRSSATVPLRDLLPESAAGTPLQVAYSINGVRRVLYTGIVTKRSYSVSGVDRTVQATDILSRLEKSIKEGCSGTDGLLFDSTPWTTAITNVLNRAGITDAEIASIDDPSGGLMTVGAVEAICHTPDENLDSIFAELLKMNGATAYVLPASGQVKVVAISRTPPASPSLVYSNRDSGAYRWNRVSHVLMGVEDVVNRMTATGGMVDDGVQVVQTWVATGITGRADSISCDYWQQQAQVDWASEFYGRLHCREERIFEVAAPVDLDVLPGMACQIDAPLAGLDHQPALITAADVRGTKMTLTCSLGPSKLDGYAQGMLPVADFAMIVVAERVLISGQPATIYDVYCDATSSFDPDGEIVSYAWSVAGATPLNTPSQTAQTTIFLDTLVGVEITLTVTDDNSTPNTDSLTRATDAPGVQVWTRIVSTACGTDGWRILVDQEGWKSFARAGRSCVSVPRFNDSGPLLSLWDDGEVWRWDDYNANPVHIGTLPGTTGAIIASTEGKPDAVFASAGAALYRSSDGGATWELLWTFSGTITTIEAGYNDPTYIRVSVGNQLWHSYSSGLTWEVAASGPAGTTVRAIANSGAGHLATLTGGTVPTLFDEGHPVDWAGTVAPPDELDAASALLNEPGYVVGRSTSNALWKLLWNGSQFDASDIAAAPTGPAALLRDGVLPDVVYGAGNPTFKLLALSSLYDLDTVQSQQIGYGKLRVPTVTVSAQLVLSLDGAAIWSGGASNDSVLVATAQNIWQELSLERFEASHLGYKPGMFYTYRGGGANDHIFDRYVYANKQWSYTASFYVLPADDYNYAVIRLARNSDELYVFRIHYASILDNAAEVGKFTSWGSGAPTAVFFNADAYAGVRYGYEFYGSSITSDDKLVVSTWRYFGGSSNRHVWSYFLYDGTSVPASSIVSGEALNGSKGGYRNHQYHAAWTSTTAVHAILNHENDPTQSMHVDGATRTNTAFYGQTVIGAFHSETYPDTAWMAVGQTVYRVANRGTGQQQVIYNAPSAIAWFFVTHASDGTDLLLVACENGGDTDFHVSRDSGATWAKEATITRGTGFAIRAAFLLPEV